MLMDPKTKSWIFLKENISKCTPKSETWIFKENWPLIQNHLFLKKIFSGTLGIVSMPQMFSLEITKSKSRIKKKTYAQGHLDWKRA